MAKKQITSIKRARNNPTIKSALNKMTLHQKEQLLEKIIDYYGLKYEAFVWGSIKLIEGRK